MPNEPKVAAGPPLPGMWRLGWLLFMQPIVLHRMYRAWGLEGDPSLIGLWRVGASCRRIARTLMAKYVTIVLITILLTVLLIAIVLTSSDLLAKGILLSSGESVSVVGAAAFCVAFGAGLGSLFVIGESMASGVAYGVTYGLTYALTLSMTVGQMHSLAVGVAFGVAFGVALAVKSEVQWGVVKGNLSLIRSIGIGVLGSAAVGIVAGSTVSVAFGVIVSASIALVLLRLPLWLVEAISTLLLAWQMRRRPDAAERLAFRLPFLHHDLIYAPLPGLRACLIQLAEVDPVLGKEFINVAFGSVCQRRIARFAVIELQARELESAARDRLFVRVASYDFPFLPKEMELASEPMNAPLLAFQTAARDLIAGSTSQRQRRLALERARNSVEGFRVATARASHPTQLARRLLPTAALWLQVVYDEIDKLLHEMAERPEVPIAFVAGPPLSPDHAEDRSLFKGRGDIVKLIEHDLAPDRRGVLLVIGQRRMGKTSLCNWLPPYLGTGTTVIVSNFQSLSGDAHRETPHRRLLGDMAACSIGTLAPPESSRWGEGLRWLQDLDRTCTDRKILVVIDEVERVEDGIRDGWCSTDFLDFLRAAGDSLRNIRFLLLTAYPLHRLGPHWTDRLVSVTSRTISYLGGADAWELLTQPIPEFPDIYPEGGVDLILAQTGRHPYLLQKAGDDLCRLLNSRGGIRKATFDELIEVFDGMVRDVQVFDEIWRSRTEDERVTLQRLARSDEPGDLDPAAIQLVREDYLVRSGDKVSFAVPLFREWIRTNAVS